VHRQIADRGADRANPQLQVDLSCDDRYVNLVEQDVDLAIRMGRLGDSTLGSRYLGLNPWIIVATPGYLKVHGIPKVPPDLARHNSMVYSTVQGDARWQLTGAKGKAVVVTVQGSLRSNNLSTLLAATREGFGIAALPRYVAQNSVDSGKLTTVLDDWSLPQQEVHAVVPSPQMVPAKVKQLIDWLQGQFDQDWWRERDVETQLG
jgi:DNA-binding transcriptional LysR family regulator